MLECQVNNLKVKFEVDSGSHISTLCICHAVSCGAVIVPTYKRVQGYSGNQVSLYGQTTVKFAYNGLSFMHTFLVVNSDRVNLLGRDLCNKLNIKFTVPGVNPSDKVYNATTYKVQDTVLQVFKDYLEDSFESSVTKTVTLHVLPGVRPVFAKARPVPVRLRESVKMELQRLEKTGTITKVFTSEWASPTVNVLKDNNTIRICGDFSVSVNKYLDPVQSSLPSIEEVICRVGGAVVFSKIDLANAFLQLPLDEESKKYTTINTSEGLYRYNFLPFGLCASPGIFQSFMCQLLNDIDDVIIYHDDILIPSRSVEEHNSTLYKVLSILKQTGIKVNAKKCSFFTDKVQYLGHIFDRQGVQPNQEKVRAIIEAPSPKDVKQLQSFLGLCNFYSRFIQNYSQVVAPLYYLLRKEVKFHWGPEQQKCFETIKTLFVTSNALQAFNTQYETLLETDSSGYGVGAALMQRKDKDSDWLPVQFASRSLNDAERNYSNLEREALSVVFGCEKFRKYLLGSTFIIRNDQQPLRKLLAHDKGVPSTCSARLQRWALRLSQFHYKFEYSKGEANVTSDCLSRLPLPETHNETEPYELIFTIDSLNSYPITCSTIQHHTDKDGDLTQLKHYIRYGYPVQENNPKLSQFKKLITEMSILKGCIMYNNRVFIPESLREPVLRQFHEGHPGICAMKSLARSLIWYPGMDKDIASVVNSCPKCQSVQSRPPQNQTVEWPVPPRPWCRVHIDHFFFENKVCLIAVDALSKYIECEIVNTTNVSDTIDALRLIFSRNGLCDVLVSDNASCFTAEEFKVFLLDNGIHHITPPPYSPASNGQAERGVRVLKDLLKKCDASGSLKTRLAKVLFYYRSVPHSVTQIAPSVALNGRKLVTLKDKVNPKYCYSPNLQSRNKQIKEFKVGDRVLALNLRSGPKWFNAVIVEKLGINVYNVQISQLDVIWKRHANQLLLISSDLKDQIKSDLSQQPQPRAGTFDNLINLPYATGPRIEMGPPNPPPITLSTPVGDPARVAPQVESHTGNQGEGPVALRRSTRIRKPVLRYGFDD